jgi:hypothetical protein
MTEKFGMRSAYGAFGIVATALFVAAFALHAQGQGTQGPTSSAQTQQRSTPSAQTQQADVCASMTQERCVPEVIRMRRGTVSTGYTVDRSYKTIQAGDPTIIDVRVLSDRTFNVVAETIGRTNFVLFDEAGGVVKNVEVIVEDDFRDASQHTVEIHNLGVQDQIGSLVGSTDFECSARRCRFLRQTETARPTQVFQYRGLPEGVTPQPR